MSGDWSAVCWARSSAVAGDDSYNVKKDRTAVPLGPFLQNQQQSDGNQDLLIGLLTEQEKEDQQKQQIPGVDVPQMEPGQQPVQKPSLWRTCGLLLRRVRRPSRRWTARLRVDARRRGLRRRGRGRSPGNGPRSRFLLGDAAVCPLLVADVPVIHAIPPIPTGIFSPDG